MSLRYNVATLLQEPIGATREYDIDDVVVMDDGGQPRSERVAGSARFLRTKHGVLVTGHLEGIQHDQCSRCLSDVAVPMRLDIEEEFFARVNLRTGVPLPAPKEPEAFRVDAEHMLDLEEAVRQCWAASAPVQPLCRPECRGLCPRCGKDLNTGACVCPPEEDERWSQLRQLVRKQEGI